MQYSQAFLLEKPPAIVKDLSVWQYVVNKMTNNGTVEISMPGVIKYYQSKVIYLKNKK